jgi:tRNA-Thr(GGU) m(6)t(6)A37 methyltransferase TsaA
MSISRRDICGRSLKIGSCGLLRSVLGRLGRANRGYADAERVYLLMRPIGRVESEEESAYLRIFEPYRDALGPLGAYSHIFVLYWFDRNDTPDKRRILQVHPRGNRNNPLTGVFARRAPVRPNLIGLTLCRIESVADAVVRIEKIDALNGSPVVDIKPYIPAIDGTSEDIRMPDRLSG